MTFAREDVARACRAWGGHLWLPPDIDGPRLMWAISGCESSFGANCTPRHEPAYDLGGRYASDPAQAKLLEQFGAAGACSYGPWQIMLVNCQSGVSPDDMTRAERCAMETAGFINRRILQHLQAKTIEAIAMAYNSGKWNWEDVPAGVARYAAQCREYYDSEPMSASDGSEGQL